ncbi:hypothetical protein Salat_1147900 [Sesamum alatum]|uniref:Uncharacterized protein n=1 Tax=Sesamum alatum TaxID=300844 RepID=A0AAE1YE81_9LAMI|nr:hypothetical protein Salat_1147900 [Sesamum alatum]
MPLDFSTGILFGLPTIPCVVSVQLRLNATVCPVLSTTTGVLASAVQSVGTVVNTTVGAPLNVVITEFIHLTVQLMSFEVVFTDRACFWNQLISLLRLLITVLLHMNKQ